MGVEVHLVRPPAAPWMRPIDHVDLPEAPGLNGLLQLFQESGLIEGPQRACKNLSKRKPGKPGSISYR